MTSTFTRRLARRSLLAAAAVALTALALPVASAVAQDEMEVTEVQLGTALDAGLVASPTTTFSQADGRIYAVIRLTNPSREATNIRVSFEPVDGGERRGFALEIPARRRYRTVARVGTQRAPGQYRCVVRTEDGRELASVELTITA